MIKTKEQMFLAEMGIHTETIIEGDYTAKYKLKDLLKKYAEQCNIANVVGQSEQCTHENEVQRQGDGFVYTVCGDCGEDLD